jgi:hypothetical protein
VSQAGLALSSSGISVAAASALNFSFFSNLQAFTSLFFFDMNLAELYTDFFYSLSSVTTGAAIGGGAASLFFTQGQ